MSVNFIFLHECSCCYILHKINDSDRFLRFETDQVNFKTEWKTLEGLGFVGDFCEYWVERDK